MSYYPQPYYPPPPPVPTASPKSPGVAALLSFLVPGLGHLYTGNPISAVVWFGTAVVSWVLVGVIVGIVLLPFVYLGAIIHAHVSATNFNRRHHVIH